MANKSQADERIIAVTGLHRGDSPQPGAAVIASLRRRIPELRVIGLSYDPMESSIYSRGGDRLDAAYLLPYPRAGAAALLERLDDILKKEEIDAVIPCLDSEIPNFIELQPELHKRHIACVLPTSQSFRRRNKENLYAFCHRLDIPTPVTRAAQDLAALTRSTDWVSGLCEGKILRGASRHHAGGIAGRL
jgi:carbamoyl-phosphate synthase large subunit